MKDQRAHTEAEPLKLSPEQAELVREALEKFEGGEPGLTEAEVLDRAREKVKAWLPNQSA